jgi:hypothetical protein
MSTCEIVGPTGLNDPLLSVFCRVHVTRTAIQYLESDCPSHHIIAFAPSRLTQITMSIDEIEQRCNVLRQDLKVWEKKFAAENDGRKAGRDDIKGNAEICMT